VPVDEPGQDPIGEDVRLKSLDARLKAATGAETIRTGTTQPGPDKGYKQGSRVLAELIAGPAGGGLIGWALDRWLNTSPWLLLVFVILGFAAAIWNIVKISSQRAE
jgi:ATP synthase protein I